MQLESVAEQLMTGISGGAERERTALANAAATLDRLAAASELLEKFEELWVERLGSNVDWSGDGGEQILARERAEAEDARKRLVLDGVLA